MEGRGTPPLARKLTNLGLLEYERALFPAMSKNNGKLHINELGVYARHSGGSQSFNLSVSCYSHRCVGQPPCGDVPLFALFEVMFFDGFAT